MCVLVRCLCLFGVLLVLFVCVGVCVCRCSRSSWGL